MQRRATSLFALLLFSILFFVSASAVASQDKDLNQLVYSPEFNDASSWKAMTMFDKMVYAAGVIDGYEIVSRTFSYHLLKCSKVENLNTNRHVLIYMSRTKLRKLVEMMDFLYQDPANADLEWVSIFFVARDRMLGIDDWGFGTIEERLKGLRERAKEIRAMPLGEGKK